MKQGSLSERYLRKSVFEKLSGKSQGLLAGPGIGMDYSLVDMSLAGEEKQKGGSTAEDGKAVKREQSFLVTADGSGETPSIALAKAMNNFSCSFGRCMGARLLLLLPEKTKESEISRYMEQFAALAQEEKITILGGESKVMPFAGKPYFYVTLTGEGCEAYQPDRRKIAPGYDIVSVREAGILGTNLLLMQSRELLEKRFSAAFLDQAVFSETCYGIRRIMDHIRQENLIRTCSIGYAHDISENGIYGALWQAAEWMNRGILVDNSAITLKQGTIEVCEAVDRNPYLIDGTGSVLLVCEKGRDLVAALERGGISAAVIGQVTAGKERQVRITDNDIRTLESC